MRGAWFFVAALVGFAIVLLQIGLGHSGRVASAQTTTIHIRQQTLMPCDDGYHIIINQIDTSIGPKPASITVFWSDGSSTVVALSPPFESTVAHYDAFPPSPGLTIDDATAEIYDGWDGNFNLSGCISGATTTPPTSPETTPSTPETTPSTPETTPSTPETTPSTPETTPSTPASSMTSTPPASTTPPATSTSPFVPGAGQTGDSPPGGGFPLREVLIGLAIAMLGTAGATTFQVLRRSGSHT